MAVCWLVLVEEAVEGVVVAMANVVWAAGSICGHFFVGSGGCNIIVVFLAGLVEM